MEIFKKLQETAIRQDMDELCDQLDMIALDTIFETRIQATTYKNLMELPYGEPLPEGFEIKECFSKTTFDKVSPFQDTKLQMVNIRQSLLKAALAMNGE